jgi:23S rRNA (cytidine1920-2'-O)/16S rRNA (cytidine1409-2'-O)-methyltransferase
MRPHDPSPFTPDSVPPPDAIAREQLTSTAAAPNEKTYVSRAGLKLHHALSVFCVRPAGRVCADFGCNVGGFTDCLLRHGATTVYAVDTGYGTLAWTLRKDPRVIVMERTNALHAPAPTRLPDTSPVSLVVVDMGWTPQRLCVPAALKWLADSPTAPESPRQIITLIKPHYEVRPDEKTLLLEGVLKESQSERVAQRTIEELPALGVRVVAHTRSPITGGAGKGNSRGNIEYLALLEPLV